MKAKNTWSEPDPVDEAEILLLDTQASGKERVLPMLVYTVSEDGKTALSLDFSRLHSLRLGYGYAALPEMTKGVALPDETCIWKMDIEAGDVVPLLKYTDFATFQPRPEMLVEGSVHKVNHFLSLVRWSAEIYPTDYLQCGWNGYVRIE